MVDRVMLRYLIDLVYTALQQAAVLEFGVAAGRS